MLPFLIIFGAAALVASVLLILRVSGHRSAKRTGR
jgi:hypothetical protein